MSDKELKTILYETEDKVARVVLNRPEVHNAFNDIMIQELRMIFDEIAVNKEIRVVVLTGKGKSFCAGADLNWMKRVKDYSYEENLKESLDLAEMLYRIYSSPKPTIARVNGAAIGGGTGLVAVCDIAIAATKAKFSFSEVKLGLIPACISPYVIKKCGEGRCREFFLTGERLTAEKALNAGLINAVAELENIDEIINELVGKLISSGPEAIRSCKELLRNVAEMSFEKARPYTAEVIARLRISDEGQEGMNAFLEKRKPRWVLNSDG
ncbi:MAG TPA: enoyl-CoA hydratase/isomerase family protein [candidate division WOR-3 bacterium]|uniref:Enoyl-CoA hydratase/isomerase family protein n=1 Tax=candidate division WOR-3 bacterium TaxID=2052148 RepID=A0A9C9EMW0_UNCW3|nr:enoyl-CoA hydratase/isomerase family protein [candidate division WOR-3 bacterium]